MKRKCIVAIVSIISMSFVTACGQSGTSAPVAEQSSMDAEVSPVTEEASSEAVATEEPQEVGYVKPGEGKSEEATEESTEEATEESKEDETTAWTGELTEEYAMAKLKRISDAYDQLVNENGNKDAELDAMISMLPNVGYEMVNPIEGLSTKDGVEMSDQKNMDIAGFATCMYYFDNYINNNGEYFDFADYISNNNFDTFKTIADNHNKFFTENNTTDTSYIAIRNVIWTPSMYDKEMSVKNITDEITISAKPLMFLDGSLIDPKYQCDIYLDGEDTGIKMLFDENGNFLNFNDENAKIVFVNPIEFSEVK
ncbi:MAG: hypothetical protein K6A90_05400 [Lachnospiraceae bacterium]|nr:hypothetical protein [Lachnospiraceae bacterium]